MKKEETRFKERILPQLRLIENSYWIKIQLLSLVGIPDIIGCVSGHFVAIELKRNEKEKLTKIQEYVLFKIEEAGGSVYRAHPGNYAAIIEDIEQFS